MRVDLATLPSLENVHYLAPRSRANLAMETNEALIVTGTNPNRARILVGWVDSFTRGRVLVPEYQPFADQPQRYFGISQSEFDATILSRLEGRVLNTQPSGHQDLHEFIRTYTDRLQEEGDLEADWYVWTYKQIKLLSFDGTTQHPQYPDQPVMIWQQHRDVKGISNG